MATCDNCESSVAQFFHLVARSLGRLSSQSNPALQISCMRILSRTRNGERNGRGSYTAAMALSTLRFVGVLFASGGSTLKVNTSLSGSYKTPRVLVLDGSSLLISTADNRSLSRMLATTDGSFEDHFRSRKPARPNRSDN